MVETPVLLCVDDHAASWPDKRTRRPIESKYGFCFELVAGKNPIGSAIKRLHGDVQKRIVAAKVDSFHETAEPANPSRQLFWHVAEFRKERPDLYIAVHSGQLDDEKKSLALAAGADACFRKGRDPLDALYKKLDEIIRSPKDPLDLFRRALPDLLTTKFGKWVVFTAKGVRREGDDWTALREWSRRNLKAGEYVVAPVIPDQPVAEIPDEWVDG